MVNRLRRRLIFLCLACLVVIIAVIHLTVQATVKDLIEEQFRLSAKGLAVAISDLIMEDIEEYKSFIENMDVNSSYYRSMQAFFNNIKKFSNVKYIYTERRVDAENIEFILDAEPVGSPDHSPPGSINPNDSMRENVYATERPSGFEVHNYARWGHLIVAYAPIYDDDGKMLGLAGVNIDASHLFKNLYKLQVIMLICYTLIITLTTILLFRYVNIALDLLTRDKLTGAYTKRYFENWICKEFEKAVKERGNLAILMLDLDKFKEINDTYGHKFGDQVLHEFSETVRTQLRSTDYFFRYGGDEFVIMLPKVNFQHGQEIADRIRKTVARKEIYNDSKNCSISLTVSIGVAGLENSVSNVKDLLEKADMDLYEAKAKRNSAA